MRIASISVFIICLFLGTSDSFGQSRKIRRAAKSYEFLAYAKAIELYEKAARSKTLDGTSVKNLATSYRLTGDTEGAEKWYSQLMEMEEREAEDVYYYALSLKGNGDYVESNHWIREYYNLENTDDRAAWHIINEDYVSQLMKDSSSTKITNLQTNSEFSDFGPAFYEEKMIFASSRKYRSTFRHLYSWKLDNFLDLYSVKLLRNGEAIQLENFSEKINSQYHEGPMHYDAENKRIYFTRNNFYEGKVNHSEDNVNKLKIFSADIKNDDLHNLQPFEYNNDEFSVGHPTMSPEGDKLYFASDMPGGMGGTDIYMCRWEEEGWGKPKNLGIDVNTRGNEMFPFMDEFGSLFFASDGHLGLGGLDVFVSFPAPDGFTNPTNMGYPINSSKDDFSLIIDDSRRTGYFSSDRAGGKGDDDIYYFKINEPISPILTFSGKVFDKRTGKELKNAMVVVKDEKDKEIAQLVTQEDGYFEAKLERGHEYNVKASRIPLDESEVNVSTKSLPIVAHLYEELFLGKGFDYVLLGRTTDKGTLAPLQDVLLTIRNKNTNERLFKLTDAEGNVELPLEPDSEYEVIIERHGFLPVRADLSTLNMEPGVLELEDILDVEMVAIGRNIKLDNIYFDLDKYNIRPDAADELDKIVKLMTTYPTIVIALSSHTDCRASTNYNLKLSDNRAKSSAKYIVSRGIDASRISGQGFGESVLVNKCADGVPCTEDDHQANRRTEFRIVSY